MVYKDVLINLGVVKELFQGIFMPEFCFYGGMVKMNYQLDNKNQSKESKKLIKYNLETERLRLLPLEPKQLKLSIYDYGKMQKDLGLRVTNINLDEEMKYAIEIRLKKVLADVENFLWLTNWAIINKDKNQIIGFIMIKGAPNKSGEVIVGYGIEESYRKNGYATEALKNLAKWIFNNPRVKLVVADTERFNIPSHKVLENVGGIRYKETDELIWWKIERKNFV